LKDLSVRRAGQPKFRELVTAHYFMYRPLLEGLQQVDFAESEGRQLVELFAKAIKEHPLNSEDERLLNCICSQVPFFAPASLFHFLQTHAHFLQKADPAILRSVLQAAKLHGFEEVFPHQFYPLIKILAALNSRLPELAGEVEELLGFIFVQLVRGKDYSRNFVMETLVELSKQMELRPGTPGVSELFAFLRSQLESMAVLPEETARREANLLF
jgi:hypothetical protein